MAGIFKNAMSYFGMADVVDDDSTEPTNDEESTFDTDYTVTPEASSVSSTSSTTSISSARSASTPFKSSQMNRITTIHPKTYEEAQLVGRAIRDGIPVVLNLTDVSEAVAYRIVDFSAGVVFGVRGSIERVTPRVFLLSPAQVNIKVEESPAQDSAAGLFD